MFSKLKLFASIFVLVALIFQVLPFGVQAQEPEVTTLEISPELQQKALQFWTHENIANAQPLTMPVDSGSPQVDPMTLFTSEVFGSGGNSPAGAADENANTIARAAYPDDWNGTYNLAPDAELLTDAELAVNEPEGTSEVYSSYNIGIWMNAMKKYPHKWVGRLSFSTSGGTSYCSATSISGNNIVTAAHCVYDSTNNVWYSNWVFTPAYRAGAAPYGSFAATTCTILTSWINLTGGYSINGWTKYDVAVCTVGKNTAGQTLNSAVGYAGRQWDWGYVRHHFTLGYPWKNTDNVYINNAGYYLRTCAAESFQQTTDTLGMGCNWGGGISGGPWLINYKPPFVNGQVNSVNSGLYVGTDNLYGIRFTSNNIVPLCTARGC